MVHTLGYDVMTLRRAWQDHETSVTFALVAQLPRYVHRFCVTLAVRKMITMEICGDAAL